MAIHLFTVSDYVKLFGISAKTASRWLAHDRELMSVPQLTIGHICEIYKLTREEINAEIYPQKRT